MSKDKLTYHQMLFELMKGHRGEILATHTIEELLLKAFPQAIIRQHSSK